MKKPYLSQLERKLVYCNSSISNRILFDFNIKKFNREMEKHPFFKLINKILYKIEKRISS